MMKLFLLAAAVACGNKPTYIVADPDSQMSIKDLMKQIEEDPVEFSGFGINFDKSVNPDEPTNIFEKPIEMSSGNLEDGEGPGYDDGYRSEEEETPSEIDLAITPEHTPEIPEVLTRIWISRNITEFYDGVKECVSEHFKATPDEVLPFADLMDDCLGPSGKRLRAYELDINFLMKKFFVDKIFARLVDGFCDGDFTACVEFYRAVQLFLELEFDLKKTLTANRDSMLDTIPEDKLNFFVELSSQEIHEFKVLRVELSEKKAFLQNFLHVKKGQYAHDYPLPPKSRPVIKKTIPKTPPALKEVKIDFNVEEAPVEPYRVDPGSVTDIMVALDNPEKSPISFIESGWETGSIPKPARTRTAGFAADQSVAIETQEGIDRKKQLDELLQRKSPLNLIF